MCSYTVLYFSGGFIKRVAVTAYNISGAAKEANRLKSVNKKDIHKILK